MSVAVPFSAIKEATAVFPFNRASVATEAFAVPTGVAALDAGALTPTALVATNAPTKTFTTKLLNSDFAAFISISFYCALVESA
jgi:hypothetical protein